MRKQEIFGSLVKEEGAKSFKEGERESKKQKDRKRRAAAKKAMKKPIILPVRELCQYEKIRESIIKERNEAMARCKFFEELNEAKKPLNEK